MTKVGIIREGKKPIDRRTPITPLQAVRIQETYPGVEVFVQPSDHRCYTDQEYRDVGIQLKEDLSDCDIIMGVKEVPVDNLMTGKTYLFFSHTIKAQAYNQGLLRKVLDQKIRLIDYELLYNPEGRRVVAFGRYAGIVGAYNALWTFGKRYNLFHLKRAYQCHDLEEMKLEYKKVKLPPIRIALTGGGRVGKGALEVLNGVGIRKVSPRDLRKGQFNTPVFALLNSRDYHRKIEGGEFDRAEFFSNPERYESEFPKYAKKIDILIAGAYWDPRASRLFERSDMIKRSFQLTVIADISCDIDGSIPCTKRSTTIEEPVYDYHASDGKEEEAFSDEANITVMAVDNLPCELPRDSSRDFGEDLFNYCLPNLLGTDTNGMIKTATIANNGELTEKYQYLKSFALGT